MVTRLSKVLLLILIAVFLVLSGGEALAQKPKPPRGGGMSPMSGQTKMITPADRLAAAQRAAKLRASQGQTYRPNAKMASPTNVRAPAPGTPGNNPGVLGSGADYFGTIPNYANSPLPTSVSIVGDGDGALALATTASGGVQTITVTNPGSGYTATATSVNVIGGGGSGATGGTLTITNGVVPAIVVTNGGNGYSATPTVSIADAVVAPAVPGTGAAATANVVNGVIVSITMTAFGSGYSNPQVTITDATGIGASASATAVNGGITAIAVTNAGTGYDLVDPNTGKLTYPGIRKFVDTLPGLGAAGANDLGNYIPVATADTTSFPGNGPAPAADYYEIALVQYKQQMHADLPPTELEGYVQVVPCSNPGAFQLKYLDNTPVLDRASQQVCSADKPSYLGPVIVATKDKPVRIKFTNYLPAGSGGNLFIPTDTTYMGAGEGPQDSTGAPCEPMMNTCAAYSQNRATLHLHGGNTPWISDGTPHQWTTPVNEPSSNKYPKGVSVQYVPDMWYDASGAPIPGCYGQISCATPGATNNPGPGTLTFYYTNQQSARLLFYHDHAYGITRLNVYAGQAAGYLITDQTDTNLVGGGNIPGAANMIPLVIQDKTFVPSPSQLAAQDNTWSTALYGGYGNLWFPHVYMPNQNPSDQSGANAMGRWDYGPWFWPPYTGLLNGPVHNPLCAIPGVQASCQGTENIQNPGTPNPSGVPEGFMDTPLVNGTPYPVLHVAPTQYRFRILNAANDRYFNLQLYQAKGTGDLWTGNTLNQNGDPGEIRMVPAAPGTAGTSSYLQYKQGGNYDVLDGRPGGVPDDRYKGPSFLQIGNEAGLLPNLVTHPNTPAGFNYNRRDIVVLNVSAHNLWLGPAERADVVVDFSQFAGQTLIMYNDSPAPVPAGDPRNDYYTGDPDQTSTGGAPSTLPGYGPNTRTVMQIQVDPGTAPATAPNLSTLGTALPAQYALGQHAPIVGESAYNTAFGASYTDSYVRIQDTSMANNTNQVQYITITNPGTGYTTAPTVTLSGGGGTGATAQAVLGTGAPVQSINVTAPGANYTSPPAVTITGGGGAGATATSALAPTTLATLTLTSPGSGYTSPPLVTISGGGGTGAQATATIGGGTVTGINITNSGTGYTSAPTVTLTGDGTGATAVAALFPTTLASITVSNGGTGYTSAPTVAISGGAGAGAAATALLTPTSVASINITNPGSGYTTPPTVTLSGGGGTGASATASLAPTTVSTIAVGSGGANYTAAPTVTISGGGGSGATATAVLGSTSVASLTLNNGGSGYTAEPGVSFVNGGGSGASATVTLGGGPLATLTIASPGSGYTTNPRISFVGGGGTGAAATAIIAAYVTRISVTNTGAGYTCTPTVTLSAPQLAGGVQATATAVMNSTGRRVASVTVTDPGSGYTSRPTVKITGCNPTTAATATASITRGLFTVTLTAPGSGYSTPPAIVVSGGNGGTGAAVSATVGPRAIASLTLTSGGSGYTSAPTIVFSGGGGSGAAATAVLGPSSVASVTVTAPGSGFTSVPTVDIAGGGGSGATATANLTPTGLGAFTVTGGSGYTTAPTVQLVGGGGSGANVNALLTPSAVNTVNVTAAGSGFTSAPTVDLTGGGGTGATATALLTGTTIASVTVTAAGTNYSTPPTVAFSGGGGNGAAATAALSPLVVTGLTVTNPGSGFTTVPTVVISGPPGLGSTATATANLTGTYVVGVSVANGGAGYTSLPTVSITGGGGTGATAGAVLGGVPIAAIVVQNPGTGYTGAPTVQFTGGGGSGAAASAFLGVNMALQPKAIQELFTTDYGRMNATLGVEVPNTSVTIQTTIPYGYVDPPTEILRPYNPAQPIGSDQNGTQLWKITHNGVDTHVIHFHLMDVQVINRVGWDGAIRPPDDNEMGWKDTVRMNPLEDIVVAVRAQGQTLPWQLPNSVRELDVTEPDQSALGNFFGQDPSGNPITVVNHLVNFGAEYVWHCHILGHEENDMMRALIFALPPVAPSNLSATGAGSTINLSWQDNSLNETQFTIQRATDPNGVWSFVTTVPGVSGMSSTVNAQDTTVTPGTTYYYRIVANNIVGDTTVYPAPAAGYPSVSADSTPSNLFQITP